MLSVLITGSLAFAITFLAIPAIIKVADEKGLFDLPDARKLHSKAIASLGGVGIFIGYFVSILLSSSASGTAPFQFFFASAILIFFLGLKDDILIISATKKFLGQLGATAILVHLGGIHFDSLHGFMGINAIPPELAIPFSYMTIIVIINAFNLIDGVDGLAGTLGLLTSASFGTYFLMAGMPEYAALAFSMTGSLLAFLFFNYNPAKIFMGDSGSLLLGLINSILVIKFINVAGASDAVLPVASAGAIGFSLLIVPLLDTLRVFSIRIARGRSPFSPDRNHVHHLLLDRGCSHSKVTLVCAGLNAGFVVLAYLGASLGPTVLVLGMIGLFYGMVGLLLIGWKSVPKLVVAKSFGRIEATQIQPTTKVVSINTEAAMAEQ